MILSYLNHAAQHLEAKLRAPTQYGRSYEHGQTFGRLPLMERLANAVPNLPISTLTDYAKALMVGQQQKAGEYIHYLLVGDVGDPGGIGVQTTEDFCSTYVAAVQFYNGDPRWQEQGALHADFWDQFVAWRTAKDVAQQKAILEAADF